jgi:hypothetical protein
MRPTKMKKAPKQITSKTIVDAVSVGVGKSPVIRDIKKELSDNTKATKENGVETAKHTDKFVVIEKAQTSMAAEISDVKADVGGVKADMGTVKKALFNGGSDEPGVYTEQQKRKKKREARNKLIKQVLMAIVLGSAGACGVWLFDRAADRMTAKVSALQAEMANLRTVTVQYNAAPSAQLSNIGTAVGATPSTQMSPR